MDPFILPMDSPQTKLANVGGKGVNLSRLTQSGFPVPPGFLITTSAYQAFVNRNDLNNALFALTTDRSKTIDDISADIRLLFEQGCIPSELISAILSAYAHYIPASSMEGSTPVVVRSSATTEDLSGVSFAGQHESYLNVRGESALLNAVKHCWSSLWTARALNYRARHNLDPFSASMGVVVQVMAPAEAAGVLFTTNPMNGAYDEVVVNAAWGLGEAIVNGLTSPDQIVVEKSTGIIKQAIIGEKILMTMPTTEGTTECEVETNQQHKLVLNAAQVQEIVGLGNAIETLYGAPQDIEWCYVKGAFFILQARPITTLPLEPVRWASPVPGAKWLKDVQAGEWATEPLSPLGATSTFAAMITARQRAFPMQKTPWSALVNGWLYVRADYQVIPMMAWLLGKALGIPFGSTLNGHRRIRNTWPEQLTQLDSLEKIDLQQLSAAEMEEHVHILLDKLGWWWWEISWDAAVALAGEQFIAKMGIPGLAEPAVLFRGNDSLLLEAERQLRQAADTGYIDAYMARFGHFVESADPIHPTLRESPDLFSSLLAVAHQSRMSPDERLVRVQRERAAAERFIRNLWGWRGFLARRVLDAGQSYAAHVDNAVFHFQRVLALIRSSFLEMGKRMSQSRILDQAEDLFFLNLDEVWAPSINPLERVSQRRLLREQQKRLAPPAFIPPLSDPSWSNDRMWQMMASALGVPVLKRGVQENNGRQIIVGTPGSPGRAHGSARVISGPDDFHRFRPGDVLIAHATTPIWTPLFQIASAAVTEVGGPYSHAAIVAREFGIPLVNGALDATHVITDGLPIVVDGSTGIVEI